MLKVILECKNVEIEKIAKYLSKFTFNFKLWVHNYMVYALFQVNSLSQLNYLTKALKRVKASEYRFIKIEEIRRFWRLRA